MLSVVSASSILVSFREADIQREQKELAQRETNLANRENEIAQREASVAKRENEDMLSDFRRKLAGPWEIEFRNWSYDQAGQVKDTKSIDNATFEIDNETQKLVIRMHVRENEFWKKDELIVRAISIQPVKEPATIDYYHEVRLDMQEGQIADGRFFAHLEIIYSGSSPVRLRGTWYDLDAAYSYAMKNLIISRGIIPQRDLPVAGSITFTKLQTPN